MSHNKTIEEMLARTDWELIEEQKVALMEVQKEHPEHDCLYGLAHWMMALQSALVKNGDAEVSKVYPNGREYFAGMVEELGL